MTLNNNNFLKEVKMISTKGTVTATIAFSALLCISILSNGLASAKAWASENEMKILLVSQFSENEKNAFLELTRNYGSEVYGRVKLVRNASDADTLVYFLEDWEALRYTLGYSGLSDVFASLGDLSGKSRGYVEADFPEYGNKRFVLYSLEDTGYSRLKCFVQDIAVAISSAGQETISSDCK